MPFYWLILGVLSVWRVTHLLHAEDGPWQFVVRLRKAAGSGFWGEMMDCFLCLSIWVSAPFAVVLGGDWMERLLLWLAMSGGAILLELVTHEPVPQPPSVEEKIELSHADQHAE